MVEITSPRFDPAPLTSRACAQLRARFVASGYTVDGIGALLGERACAALARNETTPGRLALEHSDRAHEPLAVMTRLWTLPSDVPMADARATFADSAEPLLQSGVLVAEPDGLVRAAVDIRPYGDESFDGWVVSDLTPGLDGARVRLADDYVLGVNAAATTLAQLTVRRPVASALDLGTGCGIQTLHLCRHARRVVGTDVNERALAMARVTAALADADVDLRLGSLLQPVADQRFDLVISNPPFVLSPAAPQVTGLTYRDSGRPGDAMIAELIQTLPAALEPGGTAVLLANWAHPRDGSWRARIEGWLAAAAEPVDAWVVQREVFDPAAYIELWCKDAGVHGEAGYAHRYRDWLDWFDRERIVAIGMGWVFLHRPAGAGPVQHRLEDLPGPVDQPLAPAVERWLDATDWLHADGADLDSARLRVSAELLTEQWSRPGSDDPEHLVLRQQALTRRGIECDTALAGFVGACDGELTVGQIIDALAVVLEVGPDAAADLRTHLLDAARELLLTGVLLAPTAESPQSAG